VTPTAGKAKLAKLADAKADILDEVDPKVLAKQKELHRKAQEAAQKRLAEMQAKAKEAAEAKAEAAAARAAGIKAAARAAQEHEARVKHESDMRLQAVMAKAKKELAKVKAAAELPWNGPATLPPPSKQVRVNERQHFSLPSHFGFAVPQMHNPPCSTSHH
jgi:hypothetical protein